VFIGVDKYVVEVPAADDVSLVDLLPVVILPVVMVVGKVVAMETALVNKPEDTS